MKLVMIFLAMLFSATGTYAADLQGFLKHCAYGTMIGAGVGVVSLVLSDRPSDNTGNIAKGASLGLYGGIAYGVHKLNEEPAKVNTVVDPYASLAPQFDRGRLDGARLLIHFVNF